MSYLQNPTVQLLLAVGFLIWLFGSPDPLADVIRMNLFHMKSVAVRILDSAVLRRERSVARAKLAKSRSETELLTMKTARKELELLLKPVDEKLATLDRAAKRAGGKGDLATVKQIAEEMKQIELDNADVRKRKAAADAGIENILHEIDSLDTEIRIRESKLADAKFRASKATSRKEIFMIVSELDNEGSAENEKKAEELLVHAEAEAETYKDEADKHVARRREEARIAELGAENPVESVDDIVARYMKASDK
jgi:hypothetical protein